MTDIRRTTAGRRDSGPARSPDAAPGLVQVWLLGCFEVRVGSLTIGEDGWRLRKAASLVKLLALAPGHRLHREQKPASSGYGGQLADALDQGLPLLTRSSARLPGVWPTISDTRWLILQVLEDAGGSHAAADAHCH